MPPKFNQHLGIRIAEEAQLLAEEKWIIDALKKIKKQRNCLQIEKLHLENLRAQLKSSIDQKSRLEAVPFSASASHSALDIMQNQATSSQNDHEEARFEVVEELCNIEELNLSVTNSVFNNPDPGSFDMEEEDEDMDNCVIDMNMFMYGKSSDEDGHCSSDKMLDD